MQAGYWWKKTPPVEQPAGSKIHYQKINRNVTTIPVETKEEPGEETPSFDNFIQIIDGAAELINDKKRHKLKPGNGLIILVHSQHSFQ